MARKTTVCLLYGTKVKDEEGNTTVPTCAVNEYEQKGPTNLRLHANPDDVSSHTRSNDLRPWISPEDSESIEMAGRTSIFYSYYLRMLGFAGYRIMFPVFTLFVTLISNWERICRGGLIYLLRRDLWWKCYVPWMINFFSSKWISTINFIIFFFIIY